jgi:hypothetical protein
MHNFENTIPQPASPDNGTCPKKFGNVLFEVEEAGCGQRGLFAIESNIDPNTIRSHR